ncbi:hypothetical protein Q8F55_001140 [Vanrija albida]|uniref:BD-FAE-like domain-containing protein n=1 Tax=Vanrija albida TaxID=181172 RepID=A0ABR3QFA3_9TREE
MSRIREQLAAKRAEARNSPARPARSMPPPEALEEATVGGQVARARRTGKLDISSLGLEAVPPLVYTDLLGMREQDLSRPPVVEVAAKAPLTPLRKSFASLDLEDEHAVFGTPEPKKAWSEPEELVAFRAVDNLLAEVELELGFFGGLKTLDLRGNRLTSLPDALADLLRLTYVDVSHNALTALPPALLLLPELESLNASHNAITTIDLTQPVKPSEEGLSYGTGFLVTRFERQQKAPKSALPALRNLNLAHNALTNKDVAGFAGAGPLKIRTLNLGYNKLKGTLDADQGLGAARFPELYSLVLGGNVALDGISGDLAPSADIEHEGCTWGAGSTGSTPRGSPVKPRTSAAFGTAPAYVSDAAGGPTDKPDPTLTLAFVTHPAPTFDADPLAVEMDVYLPPSVASHPDKPHPVVVWWHGGGMLQGNKENLPPHLRRLPARALGPNGEHAIVVSCNYRLAPQAPILDILADADAALAFVRHKLSAALAAKGYAARADPERVVTTGGSAGGYLALITALPVPKSASDADVGGYRGAAASKGVNPSGEWAPRGAAPFYPITDLTHKFWATKTDPVPWWGKSVPDAAAQPHLKLRDPPLTTAVSGGPRSILYMYMLQHALFPQLLFMNQRSLGSGLDGFRPSAETLSITHRLDLIAKAEVPHPPVYLAYGTLDDKVQPLEDSVAALERTKGPFEVEVLEGADHQYDEDPEEQAAGFVAWLEVTLF